MSDTPPLAAALRTRRHQPTRLEGFVDAAFAFSVSILVISVGHVPTSVPDMLHALRGMPAFALSFLLIVRIWLAHRDWSRHYDLDDAGAVRLSLVLVFLVLIFVYPLRFIFSLLLAWLSNNYLVDQPLELHSIDEYRMAFEVYGVGFAAIAAVFALMYRQALAQAERIGLDAAERAATRMQLAVWCAIGAVALASAASAALLPLDERNNWLFGVPGSLYGLIGVIAPWLRRRHQRAFAAQATA